MKINPSRIPLFSLARLNPVVRLAVVFFCSMLYVFVNDLYGAGGILLIGILIFFSSCWDQKKVSFAAIIPGGMLLLYNTILSPADAGGLHWLVFTINQAGIVRGLVTGMRLIGVMLISFAWLVVTPLPQMYAGLSWITPARAWILELLRGVQIVKREFIALTQSLIIRGLKWDSPLANVRNLVPLAMAIIPRVADNAQKTTFAMQSHHPPAPASTPEAGVEVQEASVRYSPRLPDVLHEVSVRLEPGEFTYLAGPDMAGKTTLLRLMGGVIPRIMGEYKGQVRIGGRSTADLQLDDISRSARYVAPEPFASIYGLTVGQEMLFLTKDEKSAHEQLAFMGIDHLWERETTKLSGGQQVRLVLAGALASRAPYLLLDSPMQELDPSGRRDFMQAVDALNSRGDVGVIVADPFWRQLAPYARRVLVLENGRLTGDLAPTEFFSDPWLDRMRLISRLEQPVLPAPGEVIARMQSVYVTLENNPILLGIDLEVHAGELLAIMGPNGSGKTTAMLTLARAIRPNQGKVESRGRIAYVFQDAKLQVVADTVRAELGLGPNILKWPAERASAFVADGLSWTGIDPEHSPLDLHPAQARMLAIAASNTDTAIIILDEPTVGLDAVGLQKLMGLVTASLNQGKSVVIITHDEQVASMAHRILVIQNGRVVEERKGTAAAQQPR
jgi:energy-coupling factor transport system ATP-binding protein